VKGSCVGRTVVGPSAPLPWTKPRSWYVLRAARCAWTGEGRRVEHSVVGPRDLSQHSCAGYQAAKPFDGCQLHLSGTTAALVRPYGYQTEEPFDICQYRPLVRMLYYCQFA